MFYFRSEDAMDLSFTPEEQAFREACRTWLRANAPSGLGSHNTAEGFARHCVWEKQLFEAGWAVGISADEDFDDDDDSAFFIGLSVFL